MVDKEGHIILHFTQNAAKLDNGVLKVRRMSGAVR
jgi:hypothetical protein